MKFGMDYIPDATPDRVSGQRVTGFPFLVSRRAANARYQPQPKAVGCMPS